MNILLLCHRIPYPPDKGDKIRSFHWVQGLAGRHRLALACFVDRPEDAPGVERLREWCAEVVALPLPPWRARLRALGALGSREPASLAFYRDEALSRAAADLRRRRTPDVVLLFSSSMAPYGRALDLPRVLDLVDLDSAKWAQLARRARFPRSAILSLEAARLGRFEESLARSGERLIVVSEAERDLFPPDLRARVSVIPNGVDSDRFRPDERPPEEGAIVFAGALDYAPSADAVRWFAREILPRVRRSAPRARFLVAGRGAGARLRSLERAGALTLLGHLPDVRDAYRRAAVFVAPYRVFQGVPNKVLEALSSGVPVVATPRAVRGLPGAERCGVRVAEDAEGLARAVASLLSDPVDRARLGAQGRVYAAHRYRWEESVGALEALLERAAVPAAGARR